MRIQRTLAALPLCLAALVPRGAMAQEHGVVRDHLDSPAGPVVVPPPPAEDSAVWWLTGAAGATALGGGVLMMLAVNDAATVREKGRVDTADLEQRAEIEWIAGWSLVGVGAVLGGFAIWRSLDDEPSVVTVGPRGLQWGLVW